MPRPKWLTQAAVLLTLHGVLGLVENPGENCHQGCSGTAGACPNFCGPSGACCRRGTDDAVDDTCGHGQVGCDDYHCCVSKMGAKARDDGLLNSEHQCHGQCGGNVGYCPTFCGARGACCRRGFDTDDASCGHGSAGCDNGHCCTHAAEIDGLHNSGASCHDECDGKTGACPNFCGPSGACCRKGFVDGADDAACMHGNVGCEGGHCCVRAAFTDVDNLGANCHHACDGKTGKCPAYCGAAGACCRRGLDDTDDPSCGHGAVGCEEGHCCVRAV